MESSIFIALSILIREFYIPSLMQMATKISEWSFPAGTWLLWTSFGWKIILYLICRFNIDKNIWHVEKYNELQSFKVNLPCLRNHLLFQDLRTEIFLVFPKDWDILKQWISQSNVRWKHFLGALAQLPGQIHLCSPSPARKRTQIESSHYWAAHC